MRRARGVLAVVAAVLLCGCGHRAAPPASKAKPTAVAQRPLPEWAPKHPSAEFLRAWKVLKPVPPEALAALAGGNQATMAAMRVNIRTTWAVQYELFGTLTDEQIARFVRIKEVRVPARSITPKQRKALDRFLAAWRQSAGQGREDWPDFLVMLYKRGAKQDLSNVDIGFTTDRQSHIVRVKFWIRTADGETMQQAHAFAAI